MRDIRVFAGPDPLAAAAADYFVALAAESIAARGQFAVALSGGSTPRAMHRLMASPPLISRVDWPRVFVFFGDERCVSPDDAQSNYRMARETLLDLVPIPPANVHRMHGELPPTEAAAHYETLLRTFFSSSGSAGAPTAATFDLVFLGMGDDGHTASLFPGTAAIQETQRWVVAHHVAKVGMWRITLTPPAIDAARHVAFLVAGAAKAERLRDVIEGPRRPDVLPSQIIQPRPGELHWFVDQAAASDLTQPGSPLKAVT
jgi:6-phosphogluconolactonase